MADTGARKEPQCESRAKKRELAQEQTPFVNTLQYEASGRIDSRGARGNNETV